MAITQKQKNATFKISSDLDEDDLILRKAFVEEQLSNPYKIEIFAHSSKSDLKLQDLLFTDIALSHEKTHFHGKIYSAALIESDVNNKIFLYHITAYPSFWFLKFTKNCRLFQEKKTQDIIETILRENEINDFKISIQNAPKDPRKFCIQYNESNFDFISRLLEEEGIFYYFEHSEDKHELIITDNHGKAKEHKLKFTHKNSYKDRIFYLQSKACINRQVFKTTDFNPKTPFSDLSNDSTNDLPSFGEYYEYPGNFLTSNQGRKITDLWLEHDQWKSNILETKSTCAMLSSSHKFKVENHEAAEDKYIIYAIKHVIDLVSSDVVYHNHAYSFLSDYIFRPERKTKKPRIESQQTAIVVGSSDEEIYTQECQIKIKFHWDLENEEGDDCSIWVRVAQNWAGGSFGGYVIPRVGMEVVVTFIDGNPDRPLVIGCVYNGANPPPYSKPTISGFKTNSSPGGDGFNELQFDDDAGEEQIYIHAQKDLNEDIENSRTINIKEGDETKTLDSGSMRTYLKGEDTEHLLEIDQGQQTEHIKEGDQVVLLDEGNQVTKIKEGDQVVYIKKGDQTTTIKKGDQTVNIKKGDHEFNLKKGDYTTNIKKGDHALNIKKGSSSIDIKKGDHDVTIKKGSFGVEITKGDTTFTLNKGNLEITVRGNITLDATKNITLKAGKKIILDATKDVTIDSSRSIKQTAQNSIKLDATASIKATATQKISLKSDMVTKVEATKIDLKGTIIGIKSEAVCKMSGTLTKIDADAIALVKAVIVKLG